MRVTRRTLVEHRLAILEQAGRLFRRRGVASVAVADITRAAGLTHGAFYGHFPSKDALAAESCRHSLHVAAAGWRARADRAVTRGDDPLAALIDTYLSPAHRDAPEGGCALAALGAESSRDPALRAALNDGTTALLAVLAEVVAGSRPAIADPAAIALAVLAAMNGGLILARALADSPDRSAAALAAARHAARRCADAP